MTTKLITDNQELVSATTRHGTPIKTYDDGFGSLYAYQDAGGLVGLVRALSWHDAWELVEDEILTPIPEEDVHEAYGFFIVAGGDPFDPNPCEYFLRDEDDPRVNIVSFATKDEARREAMRRTEHEERELWEGYSYQSNATGTGIVQHDLNGEALDELTPDLLAALEWHIEVKDLD